MILLYDSNACEELVWAIKDIHVRFLCYLQAVPQRT
jgi:hypothetical protein